MSILDMCDVPTRIAKGVAKLTAHFGNDDWAYEVDPATLDMAAGGKCLLGRVFGGYGKGRNALGLTGRRDSVAAGFDTCCEGYGTLNKAWQAKLTELRAPRRGDRVTVTFDATYDRPAFLNGHRMADGSTVPKGATITVVARKWVPKPGMRVSGDVSGLLATVVESKPGWVSGEGTRLGDMWVIYDGQTAAQLKESSYFKPTQISYSSF